MAEDPIYGREALRRYRERQAAAEATDAPALGSKTVAATPRTRGVRRQARVSLNAHEQSVLVELARRRGLTLSNFFRASAGMPMISANRPDAEQELKRQEWVRRKRAELAQRIK
jgi:hypothetical protein